MSEFKSIPELLEIFPDEPTIIKFLEKLRWPNKVVSPYDSNSEVYFCPSINRYKCKNTKKFFNAKTGSIFARSKIPLRKWFIAMYLFASHKKGISSVQLAKDIGISQKSAYYLLDDLRDGLEQSNFIKGLLKGLVEIDETFIGGKNYNRHKNKKVPHSQGRSWKDKVPVLGMLERNRTLIAQVVPNTQQSIIEPIIKSYVKKGANIHTDEWLAYQNLHQSFNHQMVNHRRKQYVNGEATTNRIEKFGLT